MMSFISIVPCELEVDFDETQAAIEHVGKKRKEDDVTGEMMEDAAKRAAKEVMKEMASESDKRERRLIDHMDGSVAGGKKQNYGRFDLGVIIQPDAALGLK